MLSIPAINIATSMCCLSEVFNHKGWSHIPAVLTPATGIKIWSGPFLDLDHLIAPLKEPWLLIANWGWVGCGWNQRTGPILTSTNGHLDRLIISKFTAWPLDLTLIPVAGVNTASIYVITPCNQAVELPQSTRFIALQCLWSLWLQWYYYEHFYA